MRIRPVADVFPKRKRSQIMRHIRGAGNLRTELALRSVLVQEHLSGWRRGSRLPGRPDFVFATARVAVFVDGCFWHRCPVHGQTPRVHEAFWRRKLSQNVARDAEVRRLLREKGWRMLRIWQHELLIRNRARLLRRLHQALRWGPYSRRDKTLVEGTRRDAEDALTAPATRRRGERAARSARTSAWPRR